MESTTKIAGIAGVIWAATNVAVGMSTGQPPELDASAADIRTYLVDHRSAMLAAAFAFALTLPALFAFFGELIGRLRPGPGAGPMMRGVAGPALAVFAVGFSLAYVITLPFALDESFAASASPSLLRYAWMGTFLITMVGNIGFATLLISLAAGAAVGHRAAVSATVIGVVTIAVSAAGLVSTGVTVVAGLAFLLLAIWMFSVGVGMVRAERTASAGSMRPVGA